MLRIIQPSAIVLTLITASGILLHDMHIDKATTVAISMPITMAVSGAGAAAYEKYISQNFHTHVERVTLSHYGGALQRSTLPNIHPPRDDSYKYIQNKKLLLTGGSDTTPLWPSI